jgi:hypothetical protein
MIAVVGPALAPVRVRLLGIDAPEVERCSCAVSGVGR